MATESELRAAVAGSAETIAVKAGARVTALRLGLPEVAQSSSWPARAARAALVAAALVAAALVVAALVAAAAGSAHAAADRVARAARAAA